MTTQSNPAPQLQSKVVLQQKGDTAVMPATFREMLVSLKWTKAVDLDLMAFFKKKDGSVGSVFTSQMGGSMGDLNSFPFIKLSGDAGVGDKGGNNEEKITISKIDPTIAEIYLVVVNYHAASKGLAESFKTYDGQLEVKTDTGESFGMLLDSPESGVAAVIARIDNTGIAGPKLVKENRIVTDVQHLVSDIPGAHALERR